MIYILTSCTGTFHLGHRLHSGSLYCSCVCVLWPGLGYAWWGNAPACPSPLPHEPLGDDSVTTVRKKRDSVTQ